MLALSFFSVVFSSLMWGIYALIHVIDKLDNGAFSNAGILDISIYVAFVLLPIFVLWVVFGIVSQHLHNQSFNRNMFYLMNQMKKNQDYSDLLARIMLESEQQIKDGFAIQHFDVFISDMNELISEIIQRSSLASPEQIDHLWSKVRNGGKWAFGKVIIEVNMNQPNFQMRLFEKAGNDKVLGGTIMEFCARYLGTIDLLDKHDREHVFLNVVENGVLGKVYSLLSPLAEELRHKRNLNMQQSQPSSFISKEEEKKIIHIDDDVENDIVPEIKQQTTDVQAPVLSKKAPLETLQALPKKLNLSEKLSFFKHKKESNEDISSANGQEKDSLSLALERSFGSVENPKKEPLLDNVPNLENMNNSQEKTPRFFIDFPETQSNSNLISKPDDFDKELSISATNTQHPNSSYVEYPKMATQHTLDNLRKEWEHLKQADNSQMRSNHAPIKKETIEDNQFAYPFGGWTNEENYHK